MCLTGTAQSQSFSSEWESVINGTQGDHCVFFRQNLQQNEQTETE